MMRKNGEISIFGDLEATSRAIIVRAEEEARKIIEEAKIEAENIINKAKKQAEEIINKEIKNYLKQLEDEKKQKIAEIKLKVKEDILKIQEELCEEIISELKNRISKLREQEDYKQLLRKLIIESCEALNGGNLIIKIDTKDCDIEFDIKEIENEVKMRTGNETNIKLVYDDISELGGVIALTIDESMIYDNTLDSIIEKSRNEIRKILYKNITKVGEETL